MTIQILLTLAILAFLTLTSLASPYLPTQPYPREAEYLSKPNLAGIVATITSPNGTDISSVFQTLLYQSPAMLNIADHNLSDRDLAERQIPGLPRAIDTCSRIGATFVSSECDYRASFRHSIQRYRIKCQDSSQPILGNRPSYFSELGHCNSDEICVNGPRNNQGRPTIATCFPQNHFQSVPEYNTQEGRERLEEYLRDSEACAIVSETDKQTAMNVESLEIEAGVTGVGRVGGEVGMTSQTECTHCVEVATEKLGQGTDFLSTNVKVSMAGPAAAGILWLAVLSG